MKTSKRALLFLSFLFFYSASFSQTSWTGATSVNWATATNWTAGVPTATTDVIIGDASFTGAFQPTISATATCKSLTIGGTIASTLTVNKTLTAKGDITINANGSLVNGNASVSLTGNWINNGSYSTNSTGSTVIFAGITQSLGGSAVTSFRKLTINAGSTVSLSNNIISTGTSGIITVSGTLNPSESPTYSVTADNLTVNNNSVLKVNAAAFTSNYNIATAFTLNAGSIVEYSATATSQTISSSYTYSTLRISGSGTKSLSAGLPALRSTSSSTGNIYVLSGTLDLGDYAASRGTTVAGGTFSVSNGATVKIGGTSTFPTGYNTNTLSLTSTVEYNGSNQAIAAKTYGNLLLTSSGGAVVKTMPATAFTVAGNLTSAIGAGTGVSYAAAANISVTGSFTIGASTSFDGASFSHSITGNFTNNGTFTGSTSTITMKGANGIISGSGMHNFNNLTVSASGISASSAISLSLSGNLTTSGSGTFTHAAPGAITMTGTTKTITGTGIVLNDVTLSGTITTASSFTVTGNLNISGSFIASSGNLTMNGAGKTISGAGVMTFRGLVITGSITTASNFTIAAALNVSGSFTATTGTATFTGSSTFTGTANLYNITENGTSLILASNSVLGIAGAFTFTAGSLNVTSNLPNTVVYNGNIAQTISARPYNNLVLTNGNTKTAGGAITVNNAFTIDAGTTFSASTFTHTLLGNLINNGTLNAGTSTISFTGAANTIINGATTFNILTINKTASTNTVSLLSNISVATVNMTSGSLLTGANSVTITTTRSGNGIILGTITRTHAFATATAYAFEGPYNTITFSALSGVSSVTVTVASAPVSDFPFGGAINRYYNVSVPAGTYTATLRLHYEDAELSGNDESIMQLWKYNGTVWGASGKTANNITQNWVEKSGITNLTDRWTCTDDGSVLRWTGSADNNWSNAANWSLVQGTFSGAPTSTDIAEIGTAAFTNQPSVSNSVVIKSLRLGSTQQVALTIATGGSLTTNGNISGTWAASQTHSIDAGSQNITVNGDLVLSDGTTGNAINLNIGSGTIAVTGSLVESGGANINFSGSGVLSIGKDFNYASGTFTKGTGTVTYNGSTAQIVAGVSYNNLTVSKTGGIATINTVSTVGGNLAVSAGELTVANNLSVTGNVSISASAILNGSGVTIDVGGSWSRSGTFNAGTGTINMNGAGSQTMSAGSLNNLTINKAAGTATVSGTVAINGDVNILAGTLNLGTNTIHHSTVGDAFLIADGATILVSGATNFPANYQTYSLQQNSTVHYNGAVAQTVEGTTYGNIIFSGAGAKTMAASVIVAGDLTINSGASVSAGNYAITLSGNWTNNGTFTPGTGDVILNGMSKTITGNTTFFDVTVNGNYTVAGSDITYNGAFVVTSTGSYAAGNGVATVNGDLTNSGTLTSTGTTTFSGTMLQTIRLINALVSTSTGVVNFNGTVSPVLNSTSTPTFATLNINNTGGVNPSVGWTVLVAFNVSSGASFNGGVSTHTISKNFTNNGTVTSSGILNFNPASNASLQLNGTNFSSTGIIIFGGSGLISITGTPTALQDVIIANTNPAGIITPSGWNIGGKFSINANAIFHAGSYNYTVAGDMESNGTLEGETSTFILNSSAGMLTGSPNTTFNHLNITGNITAASDFNVAGNFINDGTFDGTIGAVIMTGSNDATISGLTTPSTIAQLTINKASTATITSAVDISAVTNLFITGGTFFTSTYAVTQNAGGGVLIIGPNATLKLGGTNTIPAFSGYGLDEASTVDYAGTTQTVSNSAIYGNLKISAAGNKTAPNFLPLTIAGNFEISAGNFIAGNNTHKIAKDWTMTGGTFNNTASTIQFNGTSDQYINTIAPFNNVTISKAAGNAVLLSNVTISSGLLFTLGKIDIGAYNLIMSPGANITGTTASKYIIASGTGILKQSVAAGTSKVFPVGFATDYTPTTITLTAGSTTDNFNVRLLDNVYMNGISGTIMTNGTVKSTWIITEDVTGGSNATVTLQWPALLELPGFQRAFCFHSRYAGSYWDCGTVEMAASGSNPYTLTRSGFTSFGAFALSSADVLPVIWISLSGKNENGANKLHWSIINTTKNDHFVIEASADGVNFYAVGTAIASSVNTGIQEYDYSHYEIKSGITYYRIKSVDKNGEISYSPIIKIKSDKQRESFVLSPNPVSTNAVLSVRLSKAGDFEFTLNDASGKLVMKQSLHLEAGINAIPVDFSKQASGVYFIQLKGEDGFKMFSRLVKN